MTEKLKNGTKMMSAHCLLPTLDMPEIKNIVVKRKLVVQNSGNKTFILAFDGHDHLPRIRVNHSEVGKITRTGNRARIIFTADTPTQKIISMLQELISNEVKLLQEKIEQKKKAIKECRVIARSGVGVSVVDPDNYHDL